MKKRAKHLLLGFSLAVLLLGAMVSLVFWAWNSAEGTRLLLKTVSFFSPVRIEAEKIQGRLRDELDLQGVSIRWAQGEIRADRLHLKWQPGGIMESPAHPERAFSERGDISGSRPGSKETFLSGLAAGSFLAHPDPGRIDSFRIHEGAYRRPRSRSHPT